MTKVLAVVCAFAILAVASAAESQSPVPFLVWSGQSNLAIHNSVAQQVRNTGDALSVVDTVLSPVSGPAPEVLVAFVAPKLSAASASLLAGAYSGSEASSLSSIKRAFSTAASSLAFPEMYPVGPLPIGQKLSKMMTKHNSRLLRLSLKGECSSTLAKLEADSIIGKNQKTDLIVVSVDSFDADACISSLLEKVAAMTNGHYVALFTADAGEGIQLVFPTADSHENSVFLESGVRVMSSAGVGPLYISPAILFGLMFGLVFIITALIGICCLDSIQTPLRFPSRKVNWGKEV